MVSLTDVHVIQPINGISIGSSGLSLLTMRVPNTQSQTTLRATSVATGRIYALRCGFKLFNHHLNPQS